MLMTIHDIFLQRLKLLNFLNLWLHVPRRFIYFLPMDHFRLHTSRVSSEKETSFRENFFATMSLHFRLSIAREKMRKNAKISAKKLENYAKKHENFAKIQNLKKQMQNFSEKVAKIQQKKNQILRIPNSFSKKDLSASPIDGLTQNINIDLRTTRRHQTIHRFAGKYFLDR